MSNADERSLLDTVRELLEDRGWDVEEHREQSLLRILIEGRSGTWSCFVRTREHDGQITVHSICPRTAPEATRAAVAEFLTRVNYGLIIGNFEMDLEDGEVRYKTSIDVEDEPLSQTQMRKLMDYNGQAMDAHLPLLEEVMDATATPLEAMALLSP